METIIKELARETQLRDRQGQVVASFKGKLFTIITRLILLVLITIFVMGFVALIYNLITQGVDSNATFGIYN